MIQLLEQKSGRPDLWLSSVLIPSEHYRIKLVTPLTEWKDYLAHNVWHVKVEADGTNGLSKTSAVDTLQLRGVDAQRFVQKLGHVSPAIMQRVVLAIATVIEY